MSNSSKFSKGLGWGVIDNFSGTGINFIVGILLARALSPKDFSIIGVSLLLITISNIISDGGISTALVRKTKISQVDYNTGFTLNVITSVVVYIILFGIAPLLSKGLNIPVLTDVVRWLGIIIFISAFSIVPKAQLTRAINFKTQAVAASSSSILGAIVGLLLLYQGYGVWSFVVQQIVRQTTYTLVLWSSIQQLPSLQLSKDSARNLFSFGSRILLSGLIDAFYNNVYFYFIGKIYSGHHLGLYSRSDQFSVGLVANFALVLQKVSLPALAKIKHDRVYFSIKFQDLYNKATIFALLFSGFIAATSDHFIVLLIGSQWEESITIVKILSISALFQPLIVLYQNVLQVYGKSQQYLNIEIARKIIAAILFVLSITISFETLLYSFSLLALCSWLTYGYFTQRTIEQIELRQGAKSILVHIFPSFIVCAIVYYVGLLYTSHWLGLIYQILTFSALLLIYMAITLPQRRKQILSKLRCLTSCVR